MAIVSVQRHSEVQMKQSELGLIPLGWHVSRVGDIADVRTGPFGSVLHERDYVSHGTPIVTVEHLSERGIVHNNLPMVSDADRRRLSAYSLRTNDIVFSRVGSVDRNSITSSEENGWLFSGRLLRVRVTDEKADPHFLSYYFHQDLFKQRVRTIAVGQTMASINTQILKSVRVALPDTKAEQLTVVSVLRDTDALLTSLEKLIAKKRAIKQGAMQELLTGKRRLPGFKAKWELKRLGDVVEKLVGGGTPSRCNPAFWGDEIPWVTVKDFATFDPRQTQESITRIGLKNSASHLIPAGTLITSTRMALGMAVIYDVDVSINQDLKAIFLKTGSSVQFLYYWFEHNAQMIDALGSGSTVKGISVSELKALPFPLLSLSEQAAIAEVLSDMDVELTSLMKRWDKTRALKQGMMQVLLTGQLRLLSK